MWRHPDVPQSAEVAAGAKVEQYMTIQRGTMQLMQMSNKQVPKIREIKLCNVLCGARVTKAWASCKTIQKQDWLSYKVVRAKKHSDDRSRVSDVG